MREVPDWDAYYLGQALHIASRSKDPNTQVGALIVNADRRVISQGYNGMPEGFPEDSFCWSDDEKDDYVIHAEVNAIANAARSGAATLGGRLYITLCPCTPCARVVLAAGIKEIIFPKAAFEARIASKPHRLPIYEKAFHIIEKSGANWRMV